MPRLLPNWLDAYLVYTAENECPEVFHLFVGLSTIASALRRRSFFDMAYYIIYPNLYVALVGPAGKVKKTTAIRIGQSLLKSSVKNFKGSADSTSREKLIDNMVRAHVDGQSALTVTASEFGSLLTTSGIDMIVFLTDIFDCPPIWAHDTRGSGIAEIKHPCLNLLAGATPDWISKGMPLDTIGIGLTSRTLFVYEDVPRPAKPRPKMSEAQRQLLPMLEHDLGQISNIGGEYDFEGGELGDASKWYDQWYLSQFNLPDTDPRLASYFSRKSLHLLKLAMCVAAAQRDERIITVQDLQLALSLLDRIEPQMHRVFAGVGKNPLAADMEDALAAIMRSPNGFTLGELLDRHKISVRKDELVEIVDTLVTIGKIVLRGGRYYSVDN